MKFGNFYVSETVHIEQWSGKNERSWHAHHEGKPVAELTFTATHSLIRVSRLTVEEESLFDEIARELILLLQTRHPGYWLEIPSPVNGAIDGISVAKKSNEDRQLAEVLLKKFDARMSDATVAYEHMKNYQWGFRGRLEFYGKFPDFLNREEVREELVAKVNAVPEHLVRVSPTAENVARTV